MKHHLTVSMADEGLEYGDRTHTYNSRLAQELAVWGDEIGVTDVLHDALFQAYFVEAQNLAKTDVLVDLAGSVNLDPIEARKVIEDRRYQSVVDAQWDRASSVGVTSVPTFIAKGFGVVGAQPYEVLEGLMSRAGFHKRGLQPEVPEP